MKTARGIRVSRRQIIIKDLVSNAYAQQIVDYPCSTPDSSFEEVGVKNFSAALLQVQITTATNNKKPEAGRPATNTTVTMTTTSIIFRTLLRGPRSTVRMVLLPSSTIIGYHRI